MATISEHISTLRNLIKQVQDDTEFTDSFLYSILSSASSGIVRQEAMQGLRFSKWAYNTFCIKMINTTNHSCSCIPYGCEVTRSENKIPNPISSNMSDLIRLDTLGGKNVGIRTIGSASSDKYDPIKGNKLGAYIENGYVFLNKLTNIKVLKVSGVWADLSVWENIQYCDKTTPPCRGLYDMRLPVHAENYYQVYNLSLQLLQLPLQLNSDMTQNANPNIKV